MIFYCHKACIDNCRNELHSCYRKPTFKITNKLEKINFKNRLNLITPCRSKSQNSQSHKFKCNIKNCNKMYISLYRLNIHKRTHEGEKPFNCHICSKKFNEKGNLKIHLRIHTQEKPYKCEFNGCMANFRTYGHLKDHFSTHVDIRRYKCDYCGVSFSRKWTLKKHTYTHTGEKPFSCHLCFKKFSDKSNLTTHIKRHLNVKIYYLF